MDKLWIVGQMGPITAKNRLIRSATNEHLALNGILSEEWLRIYDDLAAGGVGTIITGHFAVDGTQRADPGQPCFWDGMPGMDESRGILRRGCEMVHSHDARIIVQISHTGLKAPAELNGRPPVGPNDLTAAELTALVERFVFMAKTCQDCGADGVQIHMAHGYLLSNFLDPTQNGREDEYGGTLENRFRLCGEIIRAVRAACGPSFAILVKVDSDGCSDLPGLLALCQKTGVDCAEVSGLDCGSYPNKREAFYLDAALAAKKGLTMPVSVVGGVFSLAEAKGVVDAGMEFVSLARALICDPGVVGKWERGEEVDSPCLTCYGCYQVYRRRPVRCVLHQRPIPYLEGVFGPYEK